MKVAADKDSIKDPMYQIQLFADIKNVICSYTNGEGHLRIDLMKNHFNEIKNKIMLAERGVLLKLFQANKIAYGDLIELEDHFRFEGNKTDFKYKSDYQKIINNKSSVAISEYEVYIA